MRFAVHIQVEETNRDRVAAADTARRQANYLGPVGFRAMRGQTDERFEERGYHRLVFPTSSTAKAFQERVNENCDSAVVTKRRRIRRKRSPGR